jgi:hypothetical protein
MKTVKVARYNIDGFPPEIARGIGEIIARWGYLQLQLGVIVRVALGMRKDAGRVVTGGANISELCRMLNTLAYSDHWVKDEDVRLRMKALAKHVQRKSSDRNDYAHGVFGDGDQPGVFVRHLMKDPEHRIRPAVQVITPAALQTVSNDARELWMRAEYITLKLKGRHEEALALLKANNL